MLIQNVLTAKAFHRPIPPTAASASVATKPGQSDANTGRNCKSEKKNRRYQTKHQHPARHHANSRRQRCTHQIRFRNRGAKRNPMTFNRKINRLFNSRDKAFGVKPDQYELPNVFVYARTIPIRIESELNAREHWHKKAQRHTMQKMAVRSFLNVDRPDIKPPCTIKLTRIAPRRFDEDNMVGGCKYIKDAVAEYFHPNLATGRADDDPDLTWQYAQEKGAPKEHALRIEIFK